MDESYIQKMCLICLLSMLGIIPKDLDSPFGAPLRPSVRRGSPDEACFKISLPQSFSFALYYLVSLAFLKRLRRAKQKRFAWRPYGRGRLYEFGCALSCLCFGIVSVLETLSASKTETLRVKERNRRSIGSANRGCFLRGHHLRCSRIAFLLPY